MGIEQRARDGGEQSSLTHATRVVTDVRDDDRLIASYLGLCFCCELLDCYGFRHMRNSTNHRRESHSLRTSAFLCASAVKKSFNRRGTQRYAEEYLWTRRLDDHCRNILIAHELIERRHIGPHDLRQLLQLRVNLRHQFIVNRIRLRRWCSFSTANHTTERSELVVESNRIVQRILTAL